MGQRSDTRPAVQGAVPTDIAAQKLYQLFSVCGVKPGLSDDAPRRFIRLGNPFLFSRVLQRGFELLAVQASFKGDLLYGSICSLIIGNVRPKPA
jgi:hypothetical protein